MFNHTHRTVQQIIQKAERLLALDQCLREHLPAPLNEHCKLANWRNGCLVIETSSAAWATQLRYLSPDLLTNLRKIPNFYGLCSIHYYVQPSACAIEPLRATPKLRLSTLSAKLIAETAEGIEDDRLSLALQRLAKSTQGKRNA